MRLIDADKLRERLFSYYGCVNECTCKSNYNGELLMAYEVADMITDCFDNATAIDPVHAAGGCYCRECKSFDKDDEGLCICKHDGGLRWPHDNSFCKYGRKREETDG